MTLTYPSSRYESEWESPPVAIYVRSFSGPAGECTNALATARKTNAEALGIINRQIGRAIMMLRKAARALERGKRSSATRSLFRRIFRVAPEFVPTWLRATADIKDRGDVVRVRCARVADMLASGRIRFFCSINGTNCPDCAGASQTDFACSSWGDESRDPRNSRVICLGTGFWGDMLRGDTNSLLSTLMHEPFHIYFGRYVTEHQHPSPARPNPGKFGGINCIVRFVFNANAVAAPGRVTQRCVDTPART